MSIGVRRAALLMFGLLTFARPALGQGTAFTYQGRLDSGGAPADGSYDLRFKLFLDPLGNTQAGGTLLTNAVPVNNGLFIVTLDFGAGTFNGTNYWLEVDVKTNGAASYSDLTPLQPITPTPYAVFAENAAGGGLATGTYSNAVVFSNALNSFTGTFAGDGTGLTNLNALTLNGAGPGAFWQLGGNNVAAGQFIGSTNNQPVEIWVNGTRSLRFEPNTNQAPNVIGGAPVNYVDPGIVGATIAGGGVVSGSFFLGTGSNHVAAIFGTIAGGRMNTIGADHGFIGGGIGNSTQPYAYDAVIGGGVENTIQTNAYDCVIGGGNGNTIGETLDYSTIAGGVGNTIGYESSYSAIGGGLSNTTGTNTSSSTIGGGDYNTINTGAADSTIGGGYQNAIQSNASDSTISGGFQNSISATGSTIGGGQANNIQSNATDSAIGGGYANIIFAEGATIAGGINNGVQSNAYYSAIGGGGANVISSDADASAISGGESNFIQTNSDHCFIGGGIGNTISNSAEFATIAGGMSNTIAGSWAFIGGGSNNTASGFGAAVAGGINNIASGNNSFAFGSGCSASGDSSFAGGNGALARANGTFVWGDSQALVTSASVPNAFIVRARGGVEFGSQALGTDQTVGWAPGSGAWAFSSDRNLKDHFAPVDVQSVLDKTCRLPLAEWSYKGYAQRHIGPMAQDWHALFPLNDSDKTLNEVDVQGVALAAIQGLNQKLEHRAKSLEDSLAQAKDENAQLRRDLDDLKQLVHGLQQKLNEAPK